MRPWLFLDSHRSGELRYGLLAKDRLRLHAANVPARRLLNRVAPLIAAAPAGIGGVVVVAGPGTFSAVRTGVLDANLLARLLHVPLVGVTVEEARDPQALFGRLRGGKAPAAPYVAPIYDAEPNITVKVC